MESLRTKQGQSNVRQRSFTQPAELGNSLLQAVTPAKSFTYIMFEKELMLMKTYSELFEYKDTTTGSGRSQATDGSNYLLGKHCCSQLWSHSGSQTSSLSCSVGQDELERPVVSSTITSLAIRSRLVYQCQIYKQIQLPTSKWVLECILYVRVTKCWSLFGPMSLLLFYRFPYSLDKGSMNSCSSFWLKRWAPRRDATWEVN